MNVGLLWYDGSSQRTVEDKVARAATRHHDKFGHWPNTCFVHPGCLDDRDELCVSCGGCQVRVLSAPNVLEDHFWIGHSGESAPELDIGGKEVGEIDNMPPCRIYRQTEPRHIVRLRQGGTLQSTTSR